ncbi:MAG: rhodanese-related sulfurtransferase [Myxococcota bacterium]|nr:rhodanese-related sulfurtransferase [Myxococcota bacterium]
MPRTLIAALYKFVSLDDYVTLRDEFYHRANALDLRGTLLLAHEGINGTIAGEESELRSFLKYLREDPRLADLVHKESWAETMPFLRLKVRLKKEIVTIGLPDVDPTERVGTYVKPKDWNALITDPDVVLIETRNDYEVSIGTFSGAIDPKTQSFTDFPAWSERAPELQGQKRVAMFCTGGIRCEKASSFLLSRGVKEVYHLEGGILQYLEDIPEEESLWEGDCFVFDERVSVDHSLKPGDYEMCAGCRRPVGPKEREAPEYIEGVCCTACHDTITPDQRARFAERHLQIRLARERGEVHLGRKPTVREVTRRYTPVKQRNLPVLYSFRRCPYAMRARMAILSAQIDVELREVVLRDKPDHMLELSPKGTVPVLWLTDGTVLDESMDIIRWALEQHDPEGWLPTDPNAVEYASAIIERNDAEFKFHLDRYKYPTRYEGVDPITHRTAAESFLSALDSKLREHPYLSGQQRGLVDAAVMPFIRQFANTNRQWFDQTPYSHLRQWLALELVADSFLGIMKKYPQWSAGMRGIAFPPKPS